MPTSIQFLTGDLNVTLDVGKKKITCEKKKAETEEESVSEVNTSVEEEKSHQVLKWGLENPDLIKKMQEEIDCEAKEEEERQCKAKEEEERIQKEAEEKERKCLEEAAKQKEIKYDDLKAMIEKLLRDKLKTLFSSFKKSPSPEKSEETKTLSPSASASDTSSSKDKMNGVAKSKKDITVQEEKTKLEAMQKPDKKPESGHSILDDAKMLQFTDLDNSLESDNTGEADMGNTDVEGWHLVPKKSTKDTRKRRRKCETSISNKINNRKESTS